ncbi:MAG: orotidine 5'-phosphate decarboxylase / HUMPS family protein, partial [bacterium]
MRFTEKLQQRVTATGSRLCVGLDPRPGDGGADAAKPFLSRVIEETSDYAAAFKPNMAYFEAMGIAGIKVLEEILKEIPSHIPIILDAKRSDIGETQKYYA